MQNCFQIRKLLFLFSELKIEERWRVSVKTQERNLEKSRLNSKSLRSWAFFEKSGKNCTEPFGAAVSCELLWHKQIKSF